MATTVDLDIPDDSLRRIIYDDAWKAVLANGELELARKKLSIHELRHIIRAACEAAIANAAILRAAEQTVGGSKDHD